MLLAIEIDNSVINFGLFDADRLAQSFKVATDINKTSDEYALAVSGILGFYNIERCSVDSAVLSSVVPQLTEILLDMVKRLFGVDATVVGKGIKTGFPIKIDNPSELGSDLVANAAAVIDICKNESISKTPCIIIDVGTVTTVFAINSRGEYIGGSILAGIEMSFGALHGKTALLPTVSAAEPARAIGKNSYESVRAGVILGHAMMIDGFIDRFLAEMSSDSAEIFITGEYAQSVIGSCNHNMRHIPELTLMGLACIYKNNI